MLGNIYDTPYGKGFCIGQSISPKGRRYFHLSFKDRERVVFEDDGATDLGWDSEQAGELQSAWNDRRSKSGLEPLYFHKNVMEFKNRPPYLRKHGKGACDTWKGEKFGYGRR